jgi:3-hydroxyacyl-CoA dehydrogenase/enoyl-CoA hydratase/3-hydroxybutyryl-CoA epimerase
MSSALKDPSRFIGLHFFNPVHRMPLVEVVAHPQASPEALARGVAYVKAIGKTPVVVQDGPGFLVNRLLMPWLNEAGFLLGQGFRIATLDHAARAFGLPMGPCELLDEIGIDVASKVAHILHSSLGARAAAAPATDRILEDAKKSTSTVSRLGRKSGLGFYFWDKPGGKRLENDQAGIDAILGSSSPPEASLESLQRQMIYPMINEAALALEEGIARHPADVDLAMIMGMGFPPFRGGLLRYADQVGLPKVVAELERLAQSHGVRLEPSAALKSLAKGRGRFYF